MTGCCLAGIFLAVNLVTSDRSPVVWTDEVMFADPAVNATLGRGFTTTAWLQPRATFFAGNAPLHSLVLVPWLEAFGVSPLAVRSLNYVLMLGAVGVLVWGARRLDLVRSTKASLILATLVLCGDGVTYSYRSGRYDCLGMFWVALMFAAQTMNQPGRRALAIALLSTLVPWTGFQLIPYVGLLGLLLVGLKGRSAIPDLVAAAVGGIVGLALLAALFSVNGVLQEFRHALFYIRGAQRTLFGRIFDSLHAPFNESSSIILLAALGLATFTSRRTKLRSVGIVGILIGIIVPFALGFSGKYVRYYAWMAYVPMALAIVAMIERTDPRLIATKIVYGLVLLACLVGFPARMAVTLLEWDLRDPEPVNRLVLETLRPGDWVYTEFEAYYPAKAIAEQLFLPPYLGIISVPGRERVPAAMTLSERERVNVLITKPARRELTLREFPGRWEEVGHYVADPSRQVGLLKRVHFGAKPYDLTVYRRVGVGALGIGAKESEERLAK